MRTISAGDVELSTLTLGRPSETATVFLHGLVAGNMATWYSTVALPLSASRQVILYDLRGHGSSSMPTQGFDLESHVDDLCSVLGELLPEDAKVDLVGHSLGALIALQFALRHPQRVHSLVLVDAPMPANHWVGPSLLAANSRDGVAAWIDEQPHLATGVTGRRRERLRQRIETLVFDTSLVADVLSMGRTPVTALAALNVPTLLIYGRLSPCLVAGDELLQALPNAQLVLLDAGHDVPIEAPSALLQAIQTFYADQHTASLAQSGALSSWT
jgi:pimeloyl-ACP methyl ester carboxylesterase